MRTRIEITELDHECVAETLRMIADQIADGFTHGAEDHEGGHYTYATAEDFRPVILVTVDRGKVTHVCADEPVRLLTVQGLSDSVLTGTLTDVPVDSSRTGQSILQSVLSLNPVTHAQPQNHPTQGNDRTA